MTDALPQPLDTRERQIVAMICQAKTNKQISHALGLSYATVKVYNHRIFQKLGVHNRTELAIGGIRWA